MRSPAFRFAAAGALALTGAWALAHVRLVHPGNSAPLRWASPDSVSIVLQANGSDDLSAAGHLTPLRSAIKSWNEAPGSTARLVEDTDPDQQARQDWQSSNLHSILFDESNASGFFPSGSGVVAITPIFFNSSGVIADADILFNGSGFRFTTSGAVGRFDVEDVAAHELGHLLGLDHTPWVGATMYPYVDPSIVLHRSLSLDDQRGMRDAYPAQSDGTISGVLQRADSSPVSGAHVVARGADGRPRAGTLSQSGGQFQLRALEGGDYDLYVTPLTGPVTSANLGVNQPIETDFGATHLGGVTVTSGADADAGTRTLQAPVGIALGRVSDDFPKRVSAGQTTRVTLRGSGFDSGGTLTASDPGITIQNVAWSAVTVQFDVVLPAGSANGHVDLEATNSSSELAILTAALEVTPADPVLDSVVPASALASGGTNLVLNGSEFRPGLRVVIGDRIYEDGLTGGCTRLDSETITLTLGETMGGQHDVVVIDESGIEGRLVGGFLAIAEPRIDSVFPESGTSAGGTRVSINGESFAPGATVTIDGVPQTDLTIESTGRIVLHTAAGTVGGPYVLTIENPGGERASSAFSFVAQEDPVLQAVDPASGTAAGGETVTLTGSGFVPGMRVVFGADSATGQGGREAREVRYLDSGTVEVVTPNSGAGMMAVLVNDTSTGQASVLEGGFTFEQAPDDDGGGCFGIVSSTPPTVRRILANSGWMLILLALGLIHARRHAAPRPALAR